jgi:hypothetical protein
MILYLYCCYVFSLVRSINGSFCCDYLVLTKPTCCFFFFLNAKSFSIILQGKSAEEIRRIFNISNNFSGEEDELHSSNTTEVTASTGKS